MSQPLKKMRSVLDRLRETLFKGLFRARFRYDVFISYSHRDAKDYAASLKKQLSSLDFSCFIDEEESPPGSSLDPTLAKALRKSAVLVLLATERALTRPYVVSEFEKFAGTQRTIVPINILGALTKNEAEALTRSPWNIINERKLVWIDETDDAFTKKNPSPPIADGIDKLFKYTRRNVRVRTEIVGTAVLVLLAAIGAGFLIKGQAREVSRQAGLAAAAKKETDRQLGIATAAGQEAQRQLTLAAQATKEAERQAQIAETAKKEAEHQQEIARLASAEAERQQRLAKDAQAEAERQQTVAEARQLANQAELARGTDSNDLITSTSIAMRSLELYPTLEGDLALRKGLNLLPSLSQETPYRGKLTAVAVSPNSTALAFITTNSEIEIRREGKDVVRKSRPALHPLITLSNDGQYVATAGGNTALIQNTDTRQSWDLTIFEDSNIRTIALSPGGKYLAIIASADEGMWVEVWERDSRMLIGRPVHGSLESMELAGVAFSSDKEELLAVGGDEKKGGAINGFLRTWIIREESGLKNECLKEDCKGKTSYSFTPQSTLRQPISVRKVAVTSGDNYLLTANRYTALVWKRRRLGDYEQIARVPLENALALAFDQGPRHVYVISQPAGWIEGGPAETDKTVKIWEAAGRRENAQVMLDEEILAVSFRQDRDLLTTISQAYGTEENGMRVWDAVRIEERKQDEIRFNPQGEFDFSGDGQFLAAADEHRVVRVWDLTHKATFGDGLTSSYFRSIEAIELSWDGRFMALGGVGRNNDPIVVVYQRRNGSYLEFSTTLKLPSGTGLDSLEISPDGRFVATRMLEDHQVKIWNVKTGRDVTPRPLVHGSQVRAILFSPNGELIVAVGANGHTMIWDASTGRKVATLGGSKSAAISNASHNVTFSHDGRYIAVGNFDGSARVFEVSTGQELILLQHDDPVTSVAFSRDGKYLAAATSAVDPDTAQRQSYRLWTWLVQPRDLIAETCKRSPRACEGQKTRE